MKSFDIYDENKGEVVDGVMQKKSLGKGNTKTVAMEILGDLLDTPTHELQKVEQKDLERLYNLTGVKKLMVIYKSLLKNRGNSRKI